MKPLQMDRQSKLLYFSTIGVLVIGLCFAVIGPLMDSGTKTAVLEAAADPNAPKPDPIDAFTEERAEMRANECGELRAIIDDDDVEQGLRAEATARLMQLMKWMEQETTIEGILRIRGYEGAVVTVHQDSANVLIKKQSLTRSESAQILELVNRETGLMGGNIKIIPIEVSAE